MRLVRNARVCVINACHTVRPAIEISELISLQMRYCLCAQMSTMLNKTKLPPTVYSESHAVGGEIASIFTRKAPPVFISRPSARSSSKVWQGAESHSDACFKMTPTSPAGAGKVVAGALRPRSVGGRYTGGAESHSILHG